MCLGGKCLGGFCPVTPTHTYTPTYQIVLIELICNTYLIIKASLRLDNTGAWVIEVYPSFLSNRMSENVDLYIK